MGITPYTMDSPVQAGLLPSIFCKHLSYPFKLVITTNKLAASRSEILIMQLTPFLFMNYSVWCTLSEWLVEL